jgi:IclR family KDG regulon transcriptional repressor
MTIQSVHRAIQVLCLYSVDKPYLGITEISHALGLHKATVQNLVRTMVEDGFLRQDPETRKYQLGLRLYELGFILGETLEINQKGSDLAHQLATKTQHLVRIAILDADEAVITLHAYPRTRPFIFRHFGPRIPLYCTALGKALLAFLGKDEIDAYIERVTFIPYTPNTITQKDRLLQELEDTKHRGFSINREEHLLASTSIGAPIFGKEGRLTASIALTGDPRTILENETSSRELVVTASWISRLMGYSPEAAAFEGGNRGK